MTPGTTPTARESGVGKQAFDLACSADISTDPVVGVLVRVQISCALPLTLVPVSGARAFHVFARPIT